MCEFRIICFRRCIVGHQHLCVGPGAGKSPFVNNQSFHLKVEKLQKFLHIFPRGIVWIKYVFLFASFVLLGSVHYKLVVQKINGLISELLFCFQFWSSGAPFLPSSRTACGQCSPDCGCCWPLSSSRRGRLFSVSTSSVAVSRVAPPVSPPSPGISER